MHENTVKLPQSSLHALRASYSECLKYTMNISLKDLQECSPGWPIERYHLFLKVWEQVSVSYRGNCEAWFNAFCKTEGADSKLEQTELMAAEQGLSLTGGDVGFGNAAPSEASVEALMGAARLTVLKQYKEELDQRSSQILEQIQRLSTELDDEKKLHNELLEQLSRMPEVL